MKVFKRLIFILLSLGLILFLSLFIFYRLTFSPPVLAYRDISDTESFRKQLEFLNNKGYKVLELEEFIGLMEKNKLPSKALALTIDAGYKHSLEAVDLLKEFGFPATLFVAVNNIGREGYLDKDDLAYITQNSPVKIGSRGLNYVYFPRLFTIELQKEVFLSKAMLENILGRPVESFSYPMGAFDERASLAVKNSGYICGLALSRGSPDIFSLRRISINTADKPRDLKNKLCRFYYLKQRLREFLP